MESFPSKHFKHSTENYYTKEEIKEPLHIQIALQYVGIIEKKGNRGIVIDSMNRQFAYIGAPYCASFVSWVLYKTNKIKTVIRPLKRTAVARRFFTKNTISASKVLINKIKLTGSYVGIFGKGETPFGHAFFTFENWINGKGKTIEANTSSGKKGSQRNGNGIWIRTRKIEPLNYFRIIGFTPIIYGTIK